MKKRLPLIIIESVASLMIFASIIISFVAGKYEKTEINPVTDVIRSSYTIDSKRYSFDELPINMKGKQNDPISITTLLPNDVKSGWSICFLSLYSKCEVFVNGRLIGSYGTSQPLPYGHMLGNIRVIIPVDESMAGQPLKLVLTPYYSVSMDISPIIIGREGEIKLFVLNKNLIRLIVITVMLTLGLTSFILLLNQIYEKSGVNVRLFSNFILLDLLVATWLLFSSDLPQFFTSANEASSLVSFLALSSFTIPYAGYCEQMFTSRKNIFYQLQIVGWCIPIINVLLFVTNTADPLDILPITHIYMICVVVLSCVFAFMEPKKTLETRFLLSGIFILFVAATGGFICFFIAPSQGYDGLFFGIGFIGFIISLFLLILSRQLSLIKERHNLEVYKHLAYNNVITGLSNRAAFDEQFTGMGERLTDGEPVTLFLFDLYNHKNLVESLGHTAGDNALRLMGRNLDKAFKAYGNRFHFGGDEFAVIIESTMVDVRKLKSAFEDLSNRTSFSSGTKLSVLVGYATLPFEKGEDFKGRLLDRATEAMREEERRLNAINSQHTGKRQ
jgi:diguanylate cyclase (GGDEF)-like protein